MPASTPCIDENAIGALFEGRLSSTEVGAIDAHVASCPDCLELLCDLARMHASSSPSRELVETAARVARRGDTGPRSGTEAKAASVERLLALLGCEHRIGTVLSGRWRLDAVVGVGGMAEVYEATELVSGRRAAIKLLRREWLSRPNVVLRFVREGQVASRLGHPGAVAVFDQGTTEDGTPFLVLELLEGRTVASHVRERLPVTTVLWIASEILDVLGAAHAQGIIHRDIKPENVVLTRSGAVKVLDFGIARVAGSGVAPLTLEGTMMGTPAYMPPEQARGSWEQVDARTDLWAVGATMFALLAGRPVRATDTPKRMLVAAMRDPAPKLSSVRPDLPPRVSAIVDRALELRREDRWQDSRAMQAAIRDVLRDLSASPDARPPRRRRATAVLVASVASLAIVTCVAVAHRVRARETIADEAATSSAPTLLAATVARVDEPAAPPSAEPEVAQAAQEQAPPPAPRSVRRTKRPAGVNAAAATPASAPVEPRAPKRGRTDRAPPRVDVAFDDGDLLRRD